MKTTQLSPLSDLPPADQRLYDFLNLLDDAAFEVTDWEAQFIADLITNPRALTAAQRAACDRLRGEYEGRL